MAANTTGNKDLDSYKTGELCLKAMELAQEILDKNGIFVAQLMCLKSMIEKNDLGNICHEHIEFYSHKSLKFLFEKNGMEIFKIEENDVNGGSYRIYCRKFNRDYSIGW